MCFASKPAPMTPTPAAAPAPAQAPAELAAPGSGRKRINMSRYGSAGGPMTRRDPSADGGMGAGTGVRN